MRLHTCAVLSTLQGEKCCEVKRCCCKTSIIDQLMLWCSYIYLCYLSMHLLAYTKKNRSEWGDLMCLAWTCVYVCVCVREEEELIIETWLLYCSEPPQSINSFSTWRLTHQYNTRSLALSVTHTHTHTHAHTYEQHAVHMDVPSSHRHTDSHWQPYWEAQAVRTQIVSALDHQLARIFPSGCSRLHVKSRTMQKSVLYTVM